MPPGYICPNFAQAFGCCFRNVVLLCSISISSQVPASSSERLWEELSNVKSMMATISDELHRFNSLYLSKLEYRMVTMASILSSLDSNVKNLQERAHVWDTFQLHVAAWNEQIKTMDKKMDILSRGQDKMMLVDGKVSTLMTLDYKMEKIFSKLEDTENKILLLEKSIDNQNTNPLFNEFATRGALSTLKVLERKIDRLHGTILQTASTGRMSPNKPGKNNGKKDDVNKLGLQHSENLVGGEETTADRGKLIIKCNTPVIVEELLKDVSSKVDVIFDKLSQDDDIVALRLGDMHNAHSEMIEEPPPPAEIRLFDKLWKRITAPHKKTVKAIEVLEETVRSVKNTTSVILQDQSYKFDQLMSYCQRKEDDFRRFTTDSELILKRTESAVNKVMAEENEKLQVIEGYFRKQRDEIDNKLSEICVKGVLPINTGHSDSPYADVEIGSGDYDDIPEAKKHDSIKNKGVKHISKRRSCEELSLSEPDSKSGVYNLGDAEVGTTGRDFFTRYCDTSTTGGGWTVIQRRDDFKGETLQNFTLLWQDYKHGFGDLDRDFWFGNEYIHRLTSEKPMILRIELEAFNGSTAWAEYSVFHVDSEENGYRLNIDGYRGNASDSFSEHNNKAFSTLDRNNDNAPPCCPCVPAYGGGWWFYSCFEANLNGVYYSEEDNRDEYRGIIWEHWLGDVSLKRTEMKIRDREYNSHMRHDADFEDIIPVLPEDVSPIDIPQDP